MRAIHDIAPGRPSDCALVMLPAAKASPEDLGGDCFVDAIRQRGWPLDVAVVDAHADYYLERNVTERLGVEIITPLRAKGYRRIWLMGMSLGGMGAITYAFKHVADVEGVILLAPFLGARGLIAEVMRAGGLDEWRPGKLAPDDDERGLLAWLKRYRPGDPELPAIFLGFGSDDRYAPASLMLARQLPAERVATLKGGHDWRTWIELWRLLLDRDPFAIATGARSGAMLL